MHPCSFKREVLDGLLNGKLRSYVHKVYQWSDIQDAHREMEADKNM